MEILIAGDFVPRYRVNQMIEQGDYEFVFGQVKVINKNIDYSIINFESPIILDNADPIKKTGPNLRCTSKALDAISYAGFNCITLANNHFYDYGERGVNDTIQVCMAKGVDFMGGGKNLEHAKRILYKEIKGKKFAFINICENEWSIATDKTGGAAPLDIVSNYYDIIEAKRQSNYVIVIVHGGREGYSLPTPRMQKEYRFFIDVGADIVVNHHQHCYSGYEEYKNKYIFYGLGNFCFDEKNERNSIWNEGYMLHLKFGTSITFELIPYEQCNNEPSVLIMQEEKRANFFNTIDKLNSIIVDKRKLEESYGEMVLKEKYLLNSLEPYCNRFLLALKTRGLLPSFICMKKKRLILNLFRCETYREILFRLLS